MCKLSCYRVVTECHTTICECDNKNKNRSRPVFIFGRVLASCHTFLHSRIPQNNFPNGHSPTVPHVTKCAERTFTPVFFSFLKFILYSLDLTYFHNSFCIFQIWIIYFSFINFRKDFSPLSNIFCLCQRFLRPLQRFAKFASKVFPNVTPCWQTQIWRQKRHCNLQMPTLPAP